MSRAVSVVVVLALVAAGGAALLLLSRSGGEDPAPDGEASLLLERPGVAAEEPTATRPEPRLEGTAEAVAVENAARDAQTAGTLFSGDVVDTEGEAAAGAHVEIVATSGVVGEALTDEAGRFGIRLVVTDALKEHAGMVRARGAEGATGQLPLYFRTRPRPGAASDTPAQGERDVGTLRLGPSNAFDVRVTSACATGLPATLWLVSVGFGVLPPWSRSETDADGAATIDGVPAGTWMLVAGAAGCGRARTFVKLPRETSDPVEIELPEAHVLTVTVRDAEDASPIVGATVSVLEQVRLPQYVTSGPLVSSPSTYETDAAGVVRIEGLAGTEVLTVRATAEGYPPGSDLAIERGSGPGTARVKPGETELVIELHRPITVRWPIENKGLGIPADGTTVAIEPWTNTGRLTVPPSGVVEDGHVVVDGWGPDGASGYAVVAGWGIARLGAKPGETVGYPTSFWRLGRIEVVARLPDGSPAEGWFLVVRDGGNNAVKPDVATDAEGRAAMEGLYGGPGALVNVSLSDTSGWGGFAMPLGSVDLNKQDGTFEAEIPGERTLRIRLTVQGRAVEEGFEGIAELRGAQVSPFEDDEGNGVPGLFVARWRPLKEEATLYVSASAPGYLADHQTVALSDVTDATEVVVDLHPSGSVEIVVEEPEDKRYKVTIQRWHPDTQTWGAPRPMGVPGGIRWGGGKRADANGLVAFPNVEPGRYRAVDTTSGKTSQGFDVPAGGEPVRVAFDISTAGWAKGRVVLPEGVPFEGVTVGEEGARSEDYRTLRYGAAALPGRPVNREDGTFWIRVPGDRPVTLHLFHATLQPHPTKGHVTLTKPREGIELVAVHGATATVRFANPAPVRWNRGQPRPISVHLYEGAVEGAGKALSGTLDAEHETVTFGGFEPGTYTVWIDAPGSAPVVLRERKLAEGATDLGEVELSRGATFEIQVTVREGQSPPRYAVWLQKLDEPTYSRSTDRSGEVIRVEGIGAGRFRVRATAYNGAAPGIQEEIEFDGTTKVVRRIDVP